MKNLMLAIAGALLAITPAIAQEIEKEKPAAKPADEKGEPAKESDAEKEDALDTLKPYRTKGNTWTHKVTSKVGESVITSYMKYEILEVTDTEATVKISTMDSNKKVLGSNEDKQSLKGQVAGFDADAKPVEEAVTVAAGDFTCMKYTEKTDSFTKHTWYDKATGLEVKITSKSDTRESTTELVEKKIS